MKHLEEGKQKEIQNLKERGYKKYPKTLTDYPEESGQMICLYQASNQAHGLRQELRHIGGSTIKKIVISRAVNFTGRKSSKKN